LSTLLLLVGCCVVVVVMAATSVLMRAVINFRANDRFMCSNDRFMCANDRFVSRYIAPLRSFAFTADRMVLKGSSGPCGSCWVGLRVGP
jgi:hypothetical protein